MDQVLSSWKEIASFLGKGVRTAQRWEKILGLPVHRPDRADHNVVFARRTELTAWMFERTPRRQARIPTILLVDNDHDGRTSTRDLLERYGYIVLTCADGARALHVFEHGPPVDMLITALQLQTVSGLELAQGLAARGRELAVIVYSEFDDVDGVAAEIRRRGWDFLTKPLQSAKLLASVRAALPPGIDLATEIPDSGAHVSSRLVAVAHAVPVSRPTATANPIPFERPKERRHAKVA